MSRLNRHPSNWAMRNLTPLLKTSSMLYASPLLIGARYRWGPLLFTGVKTVTPYLRPAKALVRSHQRKANISSRPTWTNILKFRVNVATPAKLQDSLRWSSCPGCSERSSSHSICRFRTRTCRNNSVDPKVHRHGLLKWLCGANPLTRKKEKKNQGYRSV